MRTPIISALALLGSLSAAPAWAQAVINERVAQAMPSKYTPPDCGLKAGHFKVQSGATYLKTGVETDVPENQVRALANGKRVLFEALEQNNQEKNPALWYYLGRIYLQQGDIAGADSALAKAETLSPACKKEISEIRYTGWVPLVNAGITFAKEAKNDSALALFRQASTIYRDKPQAYAAAGVIFANQKATDSAIVYFQRAAEISAAANLVEDRNSATYNLAAMLQRANRNDEAIAALERFIQWAPKDVEAKKALAGLYRTTGKTDKAKAIEQELLAMGVSSDATGAAAVGAEDISNIGVNLYNEKKYAEAASAFEKALVAEPYNRDVLSNLSNTYLALKDGPKLLATADRLVAIDPLSENALKLLREGHRLSGKIDGAVKLAEGVLALPVDVRVTDLTSTGNGAKLTGTATGRQAQTPTGKPIPPAPVVLAFEFLDAKGTPVATQEAQIPALKADETHDLGLEVTGAGITAWRYKRK